MKTTTAHSQRFNASNVTCFKCRQNGHFLIGAKHVVLRVSQNWTVEMNLVMLVMQLTKANIILHSKLMLHSMIHVV